MPRALRRFQNRVRFLSMRQRHATDERPWWKRTGDFLRRHPPEVKQDLDSDPIPEPTLVALAAIYQAQPELLEGKVTLEQVRTIVPAPPSGADASGSPWNAQALADEIARHREQFLYRVRGFRVR